MVNHFRLHAFDEQNAAADYIPNKSVMNFDGLFDRFTAAPQIFAEAGLDTKLTFDQVLPRTTFLAKVLTGAETLIGFAESD